MPLQFRARLLSLFGLASFWIPLTKEALGGRRIMDLYGRSGPTLQGGRRVPHSVGRRLSLESIHGRSQKAIRHLGGRLDALVHRLGQVLFEVGKEEPAHGLGNKGGHGGSVLVRVL